MSCLEDNIKSFIYDNAQVGTEFECIEDFILSRWASEDLADIVREGLPDWGNIALSEEGFYNYVEMIHSTQDIHVFNRALNHFLAKYALKVLVDGKAYLESLIPVDPKDDEDSDICERAKDIREAL